jgi:hypothetical protein
MKAQVHMREEKADIKGTYLNIATHSQRPQFRRKAEDIRESHLISCLSFF